MKPINVNEKIIAFHSEDEKPYGCFSNWYKRDFCVIDPDDDPDQEPVTYNCMEQYMMHQKALLFGDQETADKIMEATDPGEIKALGRQVKNFNSKVWDGYKIMIVKSGLWNKFVQHPDLADILLSTGDAILAEGAAGDKIWGTGLNNKNTEATPVSEWPGQNNLGWLLMQVRDDIAKWREWGILSPHYQGIKL